MKLVYLIFFILVLPTCVEGVSSGNASALRRESGAQQDMTRCNGVPTISSSRRACGMYIWDAPSALLYKWCHHLLKDYLYEGKGGHMFVRYESNSILQLLYPCSRYSPNRCLVCGGAYPDHLELWWSKRLYTPYDRALDKTYEEALSLQNDESGQLRRGRKSKQPLVTGPPTYAFHKRYVEDVSEIVKEELNKKKQLQLVAKRYKDKEKKLTGWSMRSFPRLKTAYILPPVEQGDNGRPSLTHNFVRSLVLGTLNNLIYLQEHENDKLKNTF